MELTGNVKARFIGKPNGVFMKGAPSGYDQNSIHTIPYKWSRMPYWELIDPPPVLKVPAAKVEDSVFEGSVFVPMDYDNADEMSKESKEALKEAMEEAKTEPAILYEPKPETLTNPVSDLINSVKAKREEPPREEPFKDSEVQPDDDMPPELRHELESMGDGVIGEEGEEKVERRKKAQK